MLNFDNALVISEHPDYVLAQAYAHNTGMAISVRLIQRLMKTHTNEVILSAIRRMQGKKVRAPMAYLSGICRNLTQQKNADVRQKKVLESAVVSFVEEGEREDRPTIERPF